MLNNLFIYSNNIMDFILNNIKEFNIPYEIRLSQCDLIDHKKNLYDISYNGGYLYNEFELDEFKESSCIYQYGIHLLKENNLSLKENYVVYIPNTEWYNIFRIKPRYI